MDLYPIAKVKNPKLKQHRCGTICTLLFAGLFPVSLSPS